VVSDVRSLEFQSATSADVPAICAMQRASLAETYASFLGRAAVEEFIAAGNVEQYFEERWQQSTVATACGAIVGVAVLEGRLLDLIWVEPSMRSKGIGSSLMDHVEHQAALDSNELTLEVWTVNRRAVDFYESRGFSIDGTLKDRVTGLEKLVMRKAL
jgi:ribosomal protein S18 acetylase RimI-like enzyme